MPKKATEAMEPQFDFLEVYIEKILNENGFLEMSQDLRDAYIPQFVAHAHRWLGEAFMPLLSPEQTQELVDLVGGNRMNAENIRAFWMTHVPDFDTKVEQVLKEYGKTVVSILQKNTQ